MPVNTKAKRMNAARVARPYLRTKLARGATSQSSRIASGNAYGGNTLSPPVGGGTTYAGYISPYGWK